MLRKLVTFFLASVVGIVLIAQLIASGSMNISTLSSKLLIEMIAAIEIPQSMSCDSFYAGKGFED